MVRGWVGGFIIVLIKSFCSSLRLGLILRLHLGIFGPPSIISTSFLSLLQVPIGIFRHLLMILWDFGYKDSILCRSIRSSLLYLLLFFLLYIFRFLISLNILYDSLPCWAGDWLQVCSSKIIKSSIKSLWIRPSSIAVKRLIFFWFANILSSSHVLPSASCFIIVWTTLSAKSKSPLLFFSEN